MLDASLKLRDPELPIDAWLRLYRLGAWRIVRGALRSHCLGPPRLCRLSRERKRKRDPTSECGRPRGSRSFASSSAPRRDRASVTFGLGAEVMSTGSVAATHVTPFARPKQEMRTFRVRYRADLRKDRMICGTLLRRLSRAPRRLVRSAAVEIHVKGAADRRLRCRRSGPGARC